MTQTQALDILKQGHNVFLTGAAGSGKTYLIQQYIQYLRSKGSEPAVTASTGIAATHLNGVTIHSWSGMGIRDEISTSQLRDLWDKYYLRSRFVETDVLIIDEVSMLDAKRLDTVNTICQYMKRTTEPFGGMQVILIGDFFQLPPVKEGDSSFCFESETWRDMDIHVCYLHEQHRQKKDPLYQILSSMRENGVTKEQKDLLKTRMGSKEVEAVTKLYTHNVDVDGINQTELQKIPNKSHTFEMQYQGVKVLVEMLCKSCLAPETLELKEGARVMFVKNNFNQGYVNGSLGIVSGFDTHGAPEVRLLSGAKITVSPESWKIEENGVVKAQIFQLPLRLAWAITVHKSQGMTLDNAEIDLSKSFLPGMGYVALSRVRSLEGLFLKGFNEMALRVDPKIVVFDRQLQEFSQKTESLLKKKTVRKKRKKQGELI